MSTLFRICHLSDLHFRAFRPGSTALDFMIKNARSKRTARARDLITSFRYTVHDPVIAKYMAEFVYSHQEEFDTILVSGDLAQTGTDPDLFEARQFFAEPDPRRGFMSVLGKPTISFGQVDIFVAPGNHDRWQNDAGDAGGKLFDAMFSPLWPSSRRVNTLIVEDLLTADKLALVAVDFSLLSNGMALPPSDVFLLGQGRVDGLILRELKLETARVRLENAGIGVVWVSHFPPLSGVVGLANSLKLIDGDRLLEAARDCSVELILSGHIHSLRSEAQEGVLMFCAGCATVQRSEEGNWVHFLDIEVRAGRAVLARRSDWRWSPAFKTFLPYPYTQP
jgi:hypothetical protein